MKPLTFYNTESIDHLAWPLKNITVTLHSSALSVFTDFKSQTPSVIDSKVKAVELMEMMKSAHIRMKIVLDHDLNFIGIVSASDLEEQNILKRIKKGTARDELLVTDFMSSKTILKVFDFEQLSKSNVGDVVNALKHSGLRHCLVVDHSSHEIRGVISASDIARVLHVSIDLSTQPSFVDVFEEIVT